MFGIIADVLNFMLQLVLAAVMIMGIGLIIMLMVAEFRDHS